MKASRARELGRIDISAPSPQWGEGWGEGVRRLKPILERPTPPPMSRSPCPPDTAANVRGTFAPAHPPHGGGLLELNVDTPSASCGMRRAPVTGDVDAPAEPHVLVARRMAQELVEPGELARPAGEPAVEPDRHHLRAFLALRVERVERVAQ